MELPDLNTKRTKIRPKWPENVVRILNFNGLNANVKRDGCRSALIETVERQILISAFLVSMHIDIKLSPRIKICD